MKRISKRLFCAILAIVMLVSMITNGVFKTTAIAASIQSDYVTGDIITYGSYPQTKVTDSSLITCLLYTSEAETVRYTVAQTRSIA